MSETELSIDEVLDVAADLNQVTGWVMGNELGFFIDLQRAHDVAARIYLDKGKNLNLFMSIFRSKMRKLGRKHKLKVK
jgi:hypothetical protein